VKHLRTLEFKPYVIFIKPPSIERLRETRKNAKIISSRDDQGTAKPFTVGVMILATMQIASRYLFTVLRDTVNDEVVIPNSEKV
jgi:hypothetical protein